MVQFMEAAKRAIATMSTALSFSVVANSDPSVSDVPEDCSIWVKKVEYSYFACL